VPSSAHTLLKAHGAFPRMYHLIATNKKPEIVLSIFSTHNAVKLEINNKKNFGNYKYMEIK
jgi:hypothetical protein